MRVAIVYDRAKISLKAFPIKKTNHEILAATGKINKVHRRVGLICVYIPPKSLAKSYKSAFKLITSTIQNFKKNMKEPLIFIAGDFNKFNLAPHVEAFEDVEILETDPTCGNSCLDKIATNIKETKVTIKALLITLDGLYRSDHGVMFFQSDLAQTHEMKKRKIERRKFTDDGLAAFNQKLVEVDWTERFRGLPEDVDRLVVR